MQDFFCKECGAHGTFDPWAGPAVCAECGYSPPPIGSEGWGDALQDPAEEDSKPDDPIRRIFELVSTIDHKHIAFIRFNDDLCTFGRDAEEVSNVLGVELIEPHGFEALPNPAVKLPFDKRQAYFSLLREAGHRLTSSHNSILTCDNCKQSNFTDNIYLPSLPCENCGFDPMESESTLREVLKRGVEAAETRVSAEAQALLNYLLKYQPSDEHRSIAHYWLGEISMNLDDKAYHYEKAFYYDPENDIASQKLNYLRSHLRRDKTQYHIEDDFQSQRLLAPRDQIRTVRYECARCGGALYFSPTAKSLSCRYCGHDEIVPAVKHPHELVSGLSFYDAMVGSEAYAKPTQAKAITCSGCGANFMLAPKALSFTCPYCASESVLEESKSLDLLRPTDVIPFSITDLRAKGLVEEWLEAQHIEDSALILPLIGIYLPIWLLHVEGFVNWTKMGSTRSDLPHARMGMIDVYEPRTMILGSKRFAPLLKEMSEQVNWDDAVEYDPRFLVDWAAEIYEVSLTEAGHEARNEAIEKTRNSLRSLSGMGPHFDMDSSGVDIVSYRLVLIPLWIARYHYKGKDHPLLINGQKGTLLSERHAESLRDRFFDLLE